MQHTESVYHLYIPWLKSKLIMLIFSSNSVETLPSSVEGFCIFRH